MKYFKTNLGLLLLIFSVATVQVKLSAQLPTYTLDEGFNTGDLFRSALDVSDFHFLENGQILVGGTFMGETVRGLALVYDDGSWDDSFYISIGFSALEIVAQEGDGYIYPSIYGFNKVLLDGTPWSTAYQEFWSDYYIGGTNNPYNVERAWDIYQQENGDLLIGGAIATDTLQPGLFRGVSRIHADGSHAPTFPALNITPSSGWGAVRAIFPAPDVGWYISGGFTAINGHETNHIARLTSNFEVDTDFVSPFMYDGAAPFAEDIILVDSQSRVWVSGHEMRLQENPNDTIQIIRLLPDGGIDESFLPRKLENNYPSTYHPRPCIAVDAMEINAHPGNYIINGAFSHFEDTAQACITVVNDAGYIQDHFFQGQGATLNDFDDNEEYPYMPGIDEVKQLDDGILVVGGSFSNFLGETHYNVVRLNPGFLSTDDKQGRGKLKVWPNPARNFVQMALPDVNERIEYYEVCDLQGRVVHRRMAVYGNRFSVAELNQGLYLVKAYTKNTVYTQKIIVKN